MTPQAAGFETMVDDLLALLQTEADMLSLRREQMCELYDTILANNDARMESLLAEMASAQQDQTKLDEQLDTIRGVLARLLELPTAALKLGVLAERLSGDRRRRLREMHGVIVDRAEQLKIQHLNTALVLGEAARLNRMLLDGLFPKAGEVRTYGTDGKQGWRSATGLVDAEM
ncbi:MAG: hypothetical protein GVY16_04930 [Planctomycetes bacterium]|jgi:hypothetical protein|nr:hypothetical protein [Phycisphaerae bacterium]NBB95067.1 hypothetical protein [Planctomycetota bacterium]